MYTIEEIKERNSGFVCHIKSKLDHTKLKEVLDITEYRTGYNYYLLCNHGLAENAGSYNGVCNDGTPYKIITIDQILFQDQLNYQIY